MPTQPLVPGSAVRLLAAVSLLAVTVAACGSVAPTSSPTPSPTSAPPSVVAATPFAFPLVSFPLVSVESRGGECPSGACDRLLNIEADGSIHEVIPNDRVLGTAPPEVIDALRVEVEQADYLRIRSRPFTGTCPIAFDGQETIYTFHVTTGDREIASCKVAIDPADPLFVAVDAALKFGPPAN